MCFVLLGNKTVLPVGQAIESFSIPPNIKKENEKKKRTLRKSYLPDAGWYNKFQPVSVSRKFKLLFPWGVVEFCLAEEVFQGSLLFQFLWQPPGSAKN